MFCDLDVFISKKILLRPCLFKNLIAGFKFFKNCDFLGSYKLDNKSF